MHQTTNTGCYKMTFKTVTFAIVMGSALLFGGAAYADTMVGSSTVVDADLPAVQARCDQINTAATTDSLATNTSDGKTSTDASVSVSTSSTDTTAGGNNATISGGVEKVDELAASTTTSIDLDTVTLEQCKAAGLSK
jgi:hypothetical protein